MQSPRNQKQEEATKKKTLGGFSKLRLLLRLLLLSRPSLYPAPGERGKETKERERESCVKENEC